MARCNFCGAQFPNAQGVRAHLRHCRIYRGRTQGSPVRGTGSLPKRSVPIGRLLPEADGPQIRAQAQPAPVPRMAATPPRVPRFQQPPYDPGAVLEARERQRRQEAEQAVRHRRREITQRMKDQVIGNWLTIGYTIPPEVKARALSDIERDFMAMPIEDLPEWELTELAEAIRDKHYRPVTAAHEAAQREAERRREAERLREQTQARVADLVEYGVDFARAALRDIPDLALTDRLSILREVEDDLEDVLTGTESERMVERRVDDILDDEFEEHN
jgi:hypothetical protein